jgi:hypothetical protein
LLQLLDLLPPLPVLHRTATLPVLQQVLPKTRPQGHLLLLLLAFLAAPLALPAAACYLPAVSVLFKHLVSQSWRQLVQGVQQLLCLGMQLGQL